MSTYSVFLKWNLLEGSSLGQRVEYRPKPQSNWIAYQEVSATTTQLVVANLEPHIDYDFRVVNICSPTSESPSAPVDYQKLTCPTVEVTVATNKADLRLTVTDNPSSVLYRVDIYKDGQPVSWTGFSSGTAEPVTLNYAFAQLDPDTRYTYKISFERNGESKVCPEGSFITLGIECPTFSTLQPVKEKQVRFRVELAAGHPTQEYVVTLKRLDGSTVATQTKTPNSSDTEIIYSFEGLENSTGYNAELSLRNGSVSRACSTARGITLTPEPVNTVCSFQEAFNGSWGIQSKEFDINFSGTVYFMFDAAGIPDKLSVFKNGALHASWPAYSYRVTGAVPVSPGDKIRFVVDARVTADRSTGWMLHANCSAPFDRNMDVPGWEISVQDNNPFINYVTAECNNGQRSFTVNASPSVRTQAQVKYYKAVKADVLDANGNIVSGKAGESFRNTVVQNGVEVNDSGWQTSAIITMDQSGKPLEKGRPYVVYIKDDFGGTAKTGRTFGLGEVINNLDCEIAYGTCPTVTFTQDPATPAKLKAKIDLSSSGALGEYNFQVDAGPEGSGTYNYLKNILVQATARQSYEVEFDGLPVSGHGLLRVWAPWDSTGQKPQCYSSDFKTVSNEPAQSLCNFVSDAGGKFEVRDIRLVANGAGTIYYGFEAFSVPDQLSVYKNDTLIYAWPTGGGFIQGDVSVNANDRLYFRVDGTVGGDTTVWEFATNCSGAYNKTNTNQRLISHAVDSVKAECLNGKAVFNAKGIPGQAFLNDTLFFKAVKQYETHKVDEGWIQSNIIDKDQNGNPLVKGNYAIYVKGAQAKAVNAYFLPVAHSGSC